VPTRTRGERKEVGRQAMQGHVRDNPTTTHPLIRVHIRGGREKWATNRANSDAGVSKVEKLVETGYEDGPKEPNRPCAKGISWHLHVVRVGDGGPHFGVGRLIFPFC
jgi:hypothetical protein